MAQPKQASLVLTLLAVLILSGCISLDVKQKIKSNGDSEMEVTYDLSAFYSVANDMTAGFGNGSVKQPEAGKEDNNLTESCGKFLKGTDWKNPKCRVTENYKIIMGGESSLKGNPAFKVSRSIPYITYHYDVKNVYSELSDASKSQDQEFSDAQLSKSKQVANAMGMKFTYTVEMPGKISKADIGEVKGNQVVIDLFELSGKEVVYIESQELNLLWDLGALALILAFITWGVVAMLKKRAKTAQAQGQYPSQQGYQQVQQYSP